MHTTYIMSSTGMSSTGAFVPVAGGAAGGAAVAAGTDTTLQQNRIPRPTGTSSTGGTPVQQQQPPPPKTSSTMSTRQSDRSAETSNDEEVATMGPSFSTLLRVASPPEILALFLEDVGAVVVTSATSVSAATGNHLPLPPSATTTGTQPTARTSSTWSITSTTSTVTAVPSPSLVPRRSPYSYHVPLSCSFLPAATSKSSSTSTATPGTASPILVSRASCSANHHRHPVIVVSNGATSSFLPIRSNSTPPPSTSLPPVVCTTPKTNGTSSAALCVPDAPKKKSAAAAAAAGGCGGGGGPDDIFYYERYAKVGPFTISPELLFIAEQEWVEVDNVSEDGNVPTRVHKSAIDTDSLEALALAASTEEPNQATPLPSTSSAADEGDNQRPTTSHIMEESTSTRKTPASAAKLDQQRPAREAPNTRSGRGHFRIGQKILKKFSGYKEPFLGEITRLPTADFAYYRVSYEDGDQEDVSIDDISKHIAMYHFSEASVPIKAAKFKIGQIIEKKFPGFGRFRGKIVQLPSIGKKFYRVKYQDNDVEDIASDEIGKYVIHDLAGKKPLVLAKTSPKRKKEPNATHEVTRQVRPKVSSTVERSARVHD